MKALLGLFLAGILGSSTVQAVVINTFATGVNESTGVVLADNAADSNWNITALDTGSDGTLPRAATVTLGDDTPSGWTAPLAGTEIITRGTSVMGVSGTYTYSYQFSLNTALQSGFSIAGSVWADDQVTVYLNGNQIMAQSAVIWNQPAVAFSSVNQAYFVNGVNTLTFAVYNSGGGATGLDVSGTVSATKAVPEAGEWAMMAAALSGLIFFYRRELRDHWSQYGESNLTLC